MKRSKTIHKTIRRSSKELVDLKISMVEYKGKYCRKCGYDGHYSALTFHHCNPSEKRYEWKQLKHLPIPIIKAELDKCVLLCNNCHCEEHVKDFPNKYCNV